MEQLCVNEAIIVSVDFTQGEDVGVMLIGRQKNEQVEVINAFQGKEAAHIYRMLTELKK